MPQWVYVIQSEASNRYYCGQSSKEETVQDYTSVNLKGGAMKGSRELVPIELIRSKILIIRG